MTRRTGTRTLRRSLSLACLGALCAAPFAWAGIQPQPFHTGLFGVAVGQAVRINVVNTGEARSSVSPVVRVRDTSGRLLFESARGPLPGGAGTSVDYMPPLAGTSIVGLPSRGRTQLRVEVQVSVPEDLTDDEVRALLRGVVPTVEVFETLTGRTGFTMSLSELAFNPQPEPPDPARQARIGGSKDSCDERRPECDARRSRPRAGSTPPRTDGSSLSCLLPKRFRAVPMSERDVNVVVASRPQTRHCAAGRRQT